jgi:nucleotide-binding universal stress UspA family protein
MGPSISDSSDYLARMAELVFVNTPTRICCVTDPDPVRSILLLANSSAIDAVAIGLSKRWRLTRLFAAELNELLLHKVQKPVLLFRSASS